MNLSKSFLALKKVSPIGICRLLKDLFLKKMGKTLSSHIIHSLGGECLTIIPRAQMESESLAHEAEG